MGYGQQPHARLTGIKDMHYMDNLGSNTIAMVLAGGKGERLSPLTIRRAKPSVAFGGKYKIIDSTGPTR